MRNLNIIIYVDFKDWFWDKFNEWRGKTTNGPVAFARYLDIKPQYVSSWLSGKYRPRKLEHIAVLAEHYPDVYDVLGMEPPNNQAAFESLPPDLRAAYLEVQAALVGLDPTSAEAVNKVIEIMGKYGYKHTRTEVDPSK